VPNYRSRNQTTPQRHKAHKGFFLSCGTAWRGGRQRRLCVLILIDGIWAGYTGPGTATILPEKAQVKMASRLVPNQVIDEQIKLMRQHLDKHGFSDIQMTKLGGGDEWSRTSVKAPVVQAVLSVYKKYGIEPAI
jgi:acetylornithine deacetylase/succinyl-diaminopimelate desuccinylase-like protein